MKKIFITIFFLIFFLTFKSSSFAQVGIPGPIYDMSKPIHQETINPNINQIVALSTITTVTISKGTFQKEVTLSVYEGTYDQVKTFIAAEQSPISSYYLKFGDGKDSIIPLKPITVQVYNNYANTNTYFYPTTINALDKINAKAFEGNVKVDLTLPLNDAGFIVSVNKFIAKNDPALGVGSFTTTTAPSPKPLMSSLASTFPIILGLIIVITLIGIVFAVIYKKSS